MIPVISKSQFDLSHDLNGCCDSIPVWKIWFDALQFDLWFTWKTRATDVSPNINHTQAAEITPGSYRMVLSAAAWRYLQRLCSIALLPGADGCAQRIFLSLVTLTFDLDIQTPSEGPNTSSLWLRSVVKSVWAVNAGVDLQFVHHTLIRCPRIIADHVLQFTAWSVADPVDAHVAGADVLTVGLCWL